MEQEKFQIRALSRRQTELAVSAKSIEYLQFDLGVPDADYPKAVKNCQAIIHLAGRAHDPSADEAAYELLNHTVTRRLAEVAAAHGVRHFIFISTIKVNGADYDSIERSYTESDSVTPQESYGQSKWHGEQALKEVCDMTGMSYTILRPPLVFGPGVKANFLALMKVIKRGIPLPLQGIENARSMIFVDNLCDLIAKCLYSPAARNQTFVVADSCLSTPDLVRTIADSLDIRPRLFSLPLPILRLAGRMTGRGEMIDRLTQSLVVDDSVVRQRLNWQPPVSLEQGMRETAEWFLKANRG